MKQNTKKLKQNKTKKNYEEITTILRESLFCNIFPLGHPRKAKKKAYISVLKK